MAGRWAGLVLGVAVALASLGQVFWEPFAYAGAVLGAGVALVQFRQAKEAVIPFAEEDWEPQGDQFVLRVPRSVHRRRAPTGRLEQRQPDGS